MLPKERKASMNIDELRRGLDEAVDNDDVDVEGALRAVSSRASRGRVTRRVVVGAAAGVVVGIAVVIGAVALTDAGSKPAMVRSATAGPVSSQPAVTVAPDPISGVIIDDETHLRAEVGCPSDQPTVTVEEDAAEVRLSAHYTATNLDCLRMVTVALTSPLDQRNIVDAATGRPVRIDADNR
jgi:hypothetical protein